MATVHKSRGKAPLEKVKSSVSFASVIDEKTMVDPGVSPKGLRSMVRREARNRLGSVYSNYSFLSVDEWDFRGRETSERNFRKQKIRQGLCLATAISQFLSGISLLLVSVSTLPYAPVLLFFAPTALLSLLAALSGAFNVTIVWLRFEAKTRGSSLLCGLLLSVCSVVGLLVGAVGAVLISFGFLPPALLRRAVEAHFLSLFLLAPILLITNLAASIIMVGVLSYRLSKKPLQANKSSMATILTAPVISNPGAAIRAEDSPKI